MYSPAAHGCRPLPMGGGGVIYGWTDGFAGNIYGFTHVVTLWELMTWCKIMFHQGLALLYRPFIFYSFLCDQVPQWLRSLVLDWLATLMLLRKKVKDNVTSHDHGSKENLVPNSKVMVRLLF